MTVKFFPGAALPNLRAGDRFCDLWFLQSKSKGQALVFVICGLCKVGATTLVGALGSWTNGRKPPSARTFDF
jgi:hypothetical protein